MSAAGLAVWAGCSSSSSGGGDSNAVDPGGTYGAEISIKVVGRGSVTSKLPGINCPGTCFTRYAFKSAADVGATTGVTLTAKASDKVRFVGWTLEQAPLATRGRGPDNCNPITRPSSAPAIDQSAADVTLPFGTVQGSPPAGQEGACSGFTDVPTAYSITATFEDIPIPDAGVDADDGGGPDLYYDRPTLVTGIVGDAVGKEIGIPYASSTYLYWRWQNGAGKSGISRGYTSSNLSPATVVVQPTYAMNLFAVDYHVVFQTTEDGILHVINGSSGLQYDLGVNNCVAVASDSSYVYCRTATTLLRFPYTGGAATTLATNMPTGADMWVDPNSSNVYLTDTTAGAIVYATTAAFDGGVVGFTTLSSAQTSPAALHGNNYRLFWLLSQGGGAAVSTTSSKLSGATTYTAAPFTTGVTRVGAYYSDISYVYFASSSEIDRVSYSGGTPTALRNDINNLGGIAFDSSYAYWTAGDGRVFRRTRF